MNLPRYDTLFPKPYLPVYPGSWWKYLSEDADTLISSASDTYLTDYYEYSAAAVLSDSFYVPFLDNIPVWGYEAHTGAVSHAGSYPFTIVLYDTIVGFNWQIAYWAGNENRRVILTRDTSVLLRTGLAFDSVIIVKEYQSLPVYVPEWWYKRYYAKNTGLIREEYWSAYDSTYHNKELARYFINH